MPRSPIAQFHSLEEARQSLATAMQENAMPNELDFLAKIHDTAKADKWGWSSHFVGPYTLQTNGVAWNAFNSISGRRVPLSKLIAG
jgi:hypothetical protein